jgi:glycosyltransferase involved in cell wall biosynthesis
MAAYNGERYLPEQIRSILGQSCHEWRLLIRDDGSTDATAALLNEYESRYPEKIKVIKDEDGNIGAAQNFMRLLDHADTEYVMLCDQDDVWLSDKVSVSLARLRQQEEKDGADVPMLLFTDMLVVDAQLNIIHRSYFAYQHINPHNIALNRLLVQNVPSGCTMLMNKAMAEVCGRISPHAVMHDHWLSLVGATMGKIIYLDEPTLLYRQHSKNIFGASKYSLGCFFNKLLGGVTSVRKRFYQNVTQAKFFLEQYQDQLHGDSIAVLMAFSSLPNVSWWKKRKILFRYRIFKTGVLRNSGMMLIV